MLHRVPTGFRALDDACGGGFPVGSVIAVMGTHDSKKDDFLRLFSSRLMEMDGSALRGSQVLPERVWFLSLFERSDGAVALTLPCCFFRGMFSRSFWVSGFRGVQRRESLEEIRRDVMDGLAKFLLRESLCSVLVFSPFDDFVLLFGDERMEVLLFLERLKDLCRRQGALALLSLTSGVLDPSYEASILSKADGIVVFQESRFVCRRLLGTLLRDACFDIVPLGEGMDLLPPSPERGPPLNGLGWRIIR